MSPSFADTTIFEKKVNKKEHDAEEFASGRVSLKSSDLELTSDFDQQTIGVLFEKVKVPQGSYIHNAYIQFQVDERSSVFTSLDIQGEYSRKAEKFERRRFDISSRPRTNARVNWTPPAWNAVAERGPDQRTPDLRSLVQEIVDNPNWKKDNKMVFVITGVGQRVAESRDGSKSGAPLLHIEFGDEPLPPLPSVDWTDLDLRFNAMTVGEDSSNTRLLLPLPEGYTTPENYTATIDYQLASDGFAVGVDNGAVLSAGDSYNFGMVQYGSESTIQLYQNGRFVEEYTLVFTKLPVIELEAASIVDEPKSPGSFILNAGTTERSLPRTAMGIEIRGSTSQAFAKKSFGLELVKDDDPTDEINIALLGLRSDGDWILDAAYRDTSFVRNIVGHDIYNSMRPFAYMNGSGESKGQAAIRGRQVEVILNGSYHGVYILSERVDRKLLKVQKITVPEDFFGNELWNQVDFSNPENGSVLFKADSNDANFYNPDTLRADFEQEYPDADDIVYYAPLEELMQFVNTASDAEFIAGIENLIELDSAVDFWLLTNVTGDSDTLKKNYFLARSGAGKWFFVPWDKDATFGMRWTGGRDTVTERWDPISNNLIRRLVQLPATGFNTLVKIRWNELRGSVFSQTALSARFASYSAGVEPGNGNPVNARERNRQRWPDSGNEGANDPEVGTVPYIDNWIAEQLLFLDTRIDVQAE